jgi:transketolase
MKACRFAFTETLLEMARRDKRITAVCTDSRGSVTLTDFAKELPDQFVECGIAEQDAVGIAAGLANARLVPFVCGPASFFSMRSSEQLKVDLAYSHMNVKVVGVSGGVSYGALGSTHHAVQDIALTRAIPGLTVLLPSDANQTAAMTRSLARYVGPTYVRMGREAVPDVYDGDAPFEIGKAVQHGDGNDVAIIACGEMVWHALQAQEMLGKEGIHTRVFDMHTLAPLDEPAILQAAETGAIVTVEEHSVHGGLGGAVAEVVCQRKPVSMRILGLPCENLYSGTSADVFVRYGLTATGIADAVRSLL